VLAAFDARMQQVYWGTYVRNAQGIVEVQGEEGVFAPQAVPMPEGKGWIGAGTGWDQYHVALEQHLGGCLTNWRRECQPRARHVAELGATALQAGHAIAPEKALPVYIRTDVATKQGSRQQPRGMTKKV